MDYYFYDFSGLGIIIGFLFCLFFVQMDEQWKKILSIGATGGTFFGVPLFLSQTLGIEKNLMSSIYAYYIISFIVTVAVALIGFCTYLNN